MQVTLMLSAGYTLTTSTVALCELDLRRGVPMEVRCRIATTREHT